MVDEIETNKGWLAEDEHCPTCNSVTKVARGINKQNLKRLFFSKPNGNDILILFILLMVFFMVWRYNAETKSCQMVISNFSALCNEYQDSLSRTANLNKLQNQQQLSDSLSFLNGSLLLKNVSEES